MMDQAPTLREFLEERIKHEIAVLEERLSGDDKALLIQVKQTEQHLTALNGEQARLAADRERFLPRESFDLFLKEWGQFKTTVDQGFAAINRQLSASLGRENGIGSSWHTLVQIITAAGVVGLLLKDFLK